MNKILDFIKNNKIFFVSSIIFVISFFIVFFGRGTYSVDNALEDRDELILDCPETAEIGGEFECSININLVAMTAYGINAKYNLSEDLVVGDLNSEDWEVYSNDLDGFVLVNLDGVSDNVVVGTVKFTMPTAAVANEIYKIELTDIQVGDGDETVLNLDNISDEIRIKSNINTLDNMTLTNASLNETFNKDTLEYTGITDSDKVNIEVVKTDEYSVVTGDVGEKDIHYGTNIFTIVVTSEDGKVRTYKIELYKEYKFETNKYVYNEAENYLYTGNDSNIDVILGNIGIPNELTKDIDDNHLVISYDDEILEDIELVNISSTTYDLTKDYIYLGTASLDINKINFVNCDDVLVGNKLQVKYNDDILDEFDILSIDFGGLYLDGKNITLDKYLTYQEFVSNIIKYGNVNYKIVKGGELITNGNISDNMILEIYYGEEKIDSYNIVVYNLSFNSSIVIDKENNYIKYNKVETSVRDFLSNINVIGDVRLFISDKNGNEKDNSDIIVTGDTFTVYIGSKKQDEYKIAVRGDSNGDGKVSLTDLVQLRKHIVDWKNPETGIVENKTGVYFYALDMNNDGNISLTDLVRVRKVIVGIDIDE